MIAFLLTAIAFAAEPVRLGKLKQAPSLTPGPEVGAQIDSARIVDIRGQKFVRIGEGRAMILIPKLDQYTPKDFESAFCAPKSLQSMADWLDAGEASIEITRGLRAYVGLVAKSIRAKCDGETEGTASTHLLLPEPEIGLKFGGPGGREMKVYAKPPTPGTNEKGFVKPGAPPTVGLGATF